MKTNWILLAVMALTAVSCAQQKPQKDIKIIAHRGYWKMEGSAQNSISSMKNAMEFGAYGTEFDVHVTKDGVPILFHDDSTANGILIETATFHELINDAPKLENGETMPTLDDFLAAWNHGPIKLILEVKSASTPEAETFYVEKIVEMVDRYGITPAELEYIAFSWHVCNELLRLAPGYMVSYLMGDKTPAEVHAAGMSGIDYNYNLLNFNPNWVREAQELGMIVNAWTVNKEDVMREMIALQVDYITTDKPTLLRSVLDEKPSKRGR